MAKNDFTAEPQRSQSYGYSIRIPDRGILMKRTPSLSEEEKNGFSIAVKRTAMEKHSALLEFGINKGI